MMLEKRRHFARVMAELSELYGKEIGALLGKIYWDDLKDFEIADIEKSIKLHRNEPKACRFMPKPGDLSGRIKKEKSEKAWEKVMRRVSEGGTYETQRFDDLLIHEVLEKMGGWSAICETREKNLDAVREEFQSRYERCLVSPPVIVPNCLPGTYCKDRAELVLFISPNDQNGVICSPSEGDCGHPIAQIQYSEKCI